MPGKPKLLFANIFIEKLKKDHIPLLSSFSCGSKDEDLFLQEDALKNQEFGLSETWLLFEKENPKIISYITLMPGSFKISPNRELGGIKIADKPFSTYTNNFPCLFIGKLATDHQECGRDGATILLLFAQQRCREINDVIRLPFVALAAYRHKVDFYNKQGYKVAFTPDERDGETITMYLHLMTYPK